MRRILLLGCFVLATVLPLAGSLPISAQINTAQLGGHVLDPQGLAVAGAKVTVRSLATGATRSLTADSSGYYQFVGLPPGRHELTPAGKIQLTGEGSSGLAKLVNPEFVLTIGEAAEFDAHLQLQAAATSVTVNAAPDLIETARTQTASTINQTSINNLPIN